MGPDRKPGHKLSRGQGQELFGTGGASLERRLGQSPGLYEHRRSRQQDSVYTEQLREKQKSSRCMSCLRTNSKWMTLGSRFKICENYKSQSRSSRNGLRSGSMAVWFCVSQTARRSTRISRNSGSWSFTHAELRVPRRRPADDPKGRTTPSNAPCSLRHCSPSERAQFCAP